MEKTFAADMLEIITFLILFLLEVKSVNLTYNSVYLFWFLF